MAYGSVDSATAGKPVKGRAGAGHSLICIRPAAASTLVLERLAGDDPRRFVLPTPHPADAVASAGAVAVVHRDVEAIVDGSFLAALPVVPPRDRDLTSNPRGALS